jgi:hypothetical protein
VTGYRVVGSWVVDTQEEAFEVARVLKIFGARSAKDEVIDPVDPDDARAYRFLADKVIELFNPRDGEEAEESILADHLEMVATFVADKACTCWGRKDGDPCRRCAALGQVAGVREER